MDRNRSEKTSQALSATLFCNQKYGILQTSTAAMAWNYSVQLNDSGNLGGSADAVLVYDLQQALSVWSQYIMGIGTLVVALDITNTAAGRESGGPTSSAYIGTNAQGRSVYESSAEYELATGQHVGGTSSDITISIDPGYLSQLDVAQTLSYGSDVPANQYNPVVVFLHELMHGFGMSGWYSQQGTLPGNYESNFDSLISFTSSGAFFTGAKSEAVFGGPVPLTTTRACPQLSQMTAAAKWMPARKFLAVLS